MYEKDIRGFHRSDKAWYADANDIRLPEITLGVYGDCGGCMAELTVKWKKLYGEDLVPGLQVLNDAWRMLSEMKDLIDELAKYDKINISADKFAEMLISLGFKDLTEYKRPEKSEAKAKKINFADSNYKPLFSINDGEEIEIEIAGEWERAVCIYIDDYHFRLGGAGGLVYHIHEFSMNMATYNRKFRPATKA